MLWSDLEVGDVVRMTDEAVEYIKRYSLISTDELAKGWANKDLKIIEIEYNEEYDSIRFMFELIIYGITINKYNGRFSSSDITPVVLKVIKLKDE